MADQWFGVRCVFRHLDLGAYEERVTIWSADTFEDAVAVAEADATAYESRLDNVDFVGLTQAYQMFETPASGAEVFSLMRESELEPEAYLGRFFDTGNERQRTVPT